MLVLAVAVLLVIHVEAVVQTSHLVQTDQNLRVVSMDVTYDSEKNTVLAIVGDVSMYPNGQHTVNLHDFNTGYGVLKNINRQICLFGQAFTPKASPEKYKVGETTDVQHHVLEVNPEPMSKEDVYDLGGPNIAGFCNDYKTYYVKGIPVSDVKQVAAVAREDVDNWCVFSACSTGKTLYESL